MKKFYFLAAAMLLGAGAYAQTDLTPDRFKFANQSTGQFTINYFYKTANPVNGFPEALAGADDGFLASGNGQFTNTAEYPEIALGNYLKKYVTIEDLGGEVGKVLCIKGSESMAEYGAEPDATMFGDANMPWFNLRFYAKKSGVSVGDVIRTRIVYSVANDYTMDPEGYASDLFNVNMYSLMGANVGGGTAFSGFFAGDDFMDMGSGAYDETKWKAYECEMTVGAEDGIPLSFQIGMSTNLVGKTKKFCVLIKEITFTLNPTEELVESEDLTLEPGESVSIEEIMGGEAAFTVAGDQVSFNEAGNVYSISGVQVADAVAGETITLDRGIYVVKAGNKAEKLIVK